MEDKTMPDKIEVEVSPDNLENGSGGVQRHTVLEFDDAMVRNEERAPEARGFHFAQLSKNYWISPAFLGSYFASAFTFTATVGGYAQTAPLLSYINDDLGPSDSISYAPLANVIASAVVLQMVGCLSDIFGRRWFFIGGSCLGLLAAILGATAQSITQIVVSQALFGAALGFGLSFFWVISEIVPMRWRFLAVSGVYILSMPCNPLAAKVALQFQFSTTSHWRGCYYFLIGLNALTVLLWVLCYHPPTFKMLHRRKSAMEIVLQFDWIGLVIYSLSLILFILGLDWGGNLYPWNSGHVIGSLVGGGVGFVCFALWEIFLPISTVHPLLPMHLFKNARFQACSWLTGIGAITYYGFSLVWPQAVRSLYDGVSQSQQSTLTTTLILCFVLGQFSGGVIAEIAGVRVGAIGSAFAALPLLAGAATDPRNLNLTIGLAATGCFMVGANEGVALTAVTFPIKSQEELGAAGGLAGTIRQFCASFGTAVFSTILNNQLKSKVPRYVQDAVLATGLPQSSVPALLSRINNITAVTNETVPGFNSQIEAVARDALRNAQASSYSTVIYTSAGFAGVLILLCWWVPGFDHNKKDFVAGHIHQTTEEKKLEQE
ncbi:uncharacterized protein Z519_02182 [Cladophialophora bantiana CBS 173.52]|uniref:Major facilitator superfamily (MFS) profile domain-containing protein n=1 Tax=Cladophialophora bantiana (strain ATCC 10958 / CBS 173.52 / CDC B-1940 / NIH 8579) TaxID=1442370 RepID=A0A0D2F3F6_CLAB1|nr:uncharacterized protein Z519_02182 [Cladophialophora bantiana CBS 173.52]KIW96791.1 hypothetical protein Z519_02182 [Cladophialophora bantiana CBS 173.52]